MGIIAQLFLPVLRPVIEVYHASALQATGITGRLIPLSSLVCDKRHITELPARNLTLVVISSRLHHNLPLANLTAYLHHNLHSPTVIHPPVVFSLTSCRRCGIAVRSSFPSHRLLCPPIPLSTQLLIGERGACVECDGAELSYRITVEMEPIGTSIPLQLKRGHDHHPPCMRDEGAGRLRKSVKSSGLYHTTTRSA